MSDRLWTELWLVPEDENSSSQRKGEFILKHLPVDSIKFIDSTGAKFLENSN